MSPGEVALDLLIGFGIGTSLGLLGGGGSILTVPALIYLLGQPPRTAVMTSLAIVGANSFFGAYLHARSGMINLRAAVFFGAPGMLAAFLSSGFARKLRPELLPVLFGLLMIGVGGILLTQQSTPERGDGGRSKWLTAAAAGAGVGALTGALGVGGGFLIVPALVLLVGLPVGEAVGASLLVIGVNCIAGLAGLAGEPGLDPNPVILTAAAGMFGTWLGSRLSCRLPEGSLRRLFAVFIIGLGLFQLVDHLLKL